MWNYFKFNEPYIGRIITQINTVKLPNDYIEFMKNHNGGEGDIGEFWLQLFRLEELQKINDIYNIEEFLPEHIIIGSNGGGEFYGVNSVGEFFIISSMFDIGSLTYLCSDMNSFAENVNNFWKNL